MTNDNYDPETGLPNDQSYMECGLPLYLEESLEKMKKCLDKLNRGEEYYEWDCDIAELNSSINVAEVSEAISSDQAWYLRKKYLGMEKPKRID